MGGACQRYGVDAEDRATRTKAGVALIVVAMMVGTVGTALVVAPAFNRHTPGTFSMSVTIVPWREGQEFWVWVPVMLQDRSPN